MYYLHYEIIYNCENGKKKKTNHKQEAEHESIIVFEM